VIQVRREVEWPCPLADTPRLGSVSQVYALNSLLMSTYRSRMALLCAMLAPRNFVEPASRAIVSESSSTPRSTSESRMTVDRLSVPRDSAARKRLPRPAERYAANVYEHKS